MNDPYKDPFKKKDIEERTKKFLKDYDELCLKHQIQLGSYPYFVPSGGQGFNISSQLMPIDRKYTAVPSKPEEII